MSAVQNDVLNNYRSSKMRYSEEDKGMYSIFLNIQDNCLHSS